MIQRATILLFMSGATTAALAQAHPATRPAADIAEQYRPAAKRIIEAALAGNDAWRKLQELCDGFGHRLSGSEALEKAIDWAVATLKRDGMEARREPVMVPKWVRGRESAEMIEPRRAALPMLGLGGSVGTPPEGITAEVVCVPDKESLEKLGRGAVEGKIVLFNHPMKQYDPVGGAGYGDAVRFRGNGADWAAEFGGRAALIRSVTATSLRTPHTGAMHYRGNGPRIPTAAITIEDAEMIDRLTRRGVKVTVSLKMEARDEGESPSANVVGELRGREKPDEVVVISGHFDSWDVGQGAHDDGASCVAAMEAVNVLRKLNLIPRRTIRVVLWTNEENGLAGGKTYAREHAGELSKHAAAIEMDSGCFAPRGYSIDFADEAKGRRALEQMRDIVRLLAPLGADKATLGGSGADISPMKPAGVPLLGHEVDVSKYFDYHHTPADTIDKIKPEDLSANVAVMAISAYVLADMPGKLGE